ncbi:MAG: hypothetical protein KGL39_07270 [Patescibacteria group bacterium]|nr:hypothetical protein [Patescibacteria group bacterium]
MSFLTGLFGLSGIQAKIVEVVAVVLIAVSTYAAFALHFEHKGALGELAKLQKSSTELLAKAQRDIQTETAKHAADVKANKETTDAAIAAANALSDALDQRVRDFDAYRASHPDVPRSAGGPDAAGGGECGLISCGELASQALQDANRLARSSADLSAALQSCQRDRDSLTGMP